MKTDRELLELAAKAAGFGKDCVKGPVWTESEYPRKSGKNGALWNCRGWGDEAELWNPITDDGDALRLAHTLGITIDCDLADTMEILRRDITSAAAAIGEGME